MAFHISLCAYSSGVGHAFIKLDRDGEGVIVVGLSPRSLPEASTSKSEASLVFPQAGQIYVEPESLNEEGAKCKQFTISEHQYTAVLSHINRQRAQNIEHIPDGSRPSAKLDPTQAGGPAYALLWSNCASWALDMLQMAGVDVADYRGVIDRPNGFYQML